LYIIVAYSSCCLRCPQFSSELRFSAFLRLSMDGTYHPTSQPPNAAQCPSIRQTILHCSFLSAATAMGAPTCNIRRTCKRVQASAAGVIGGGFRTRKPNCEMAELHDKYAREWGSPNTPVTVVGTRCSTAARAQQLRTSCPSHEMIGAVFTESINCNMRVNLAEDDAPTKRAHALSAAAQSCDVLRQQATDKRPSGETLHRDSGGAGAGDELLQLRLHAQRPPVNFLNIAL